ncbi:MAG: sulfite reductase, partial [Marmoricola sp.]|nr:sulfite reductase [Marmoricola sp.]
MPDQRFDSRSPRFTEIPRPKRAEGQWALGQREPLNKNEQSKKDDDPLHVRDRILYTYSKKGFDSIDPADLRGRVRWMGLYTQRKPGIDGGRTGSMEEEELDDRFFMMRVRSDGALLGAPQLRALGTIGTAYAQNTADISDRQNIQYHWIRIEDVPAIWELLDSVGMSSMEACGDSPRPVLGSPVAGVAADEIIDGTSALEEINRRYLNYKEFSNFPRKFKTSLTGHPSLDTVPAVNDVSFVGVVHPEHGPGFDLWVGGGLSTNPMFAQKLGVWIPLDEVPDAWAGVAGIFRDYGYRRLRSRARLKFLVADWGVEKFREVLENEYLGKKLISVDSPPVSTESGDHVGVHAQKDGNFYIGAAPVVGRINGETLTGLGDLVEKFGVDGARLTAQQKLVVLGVKPADVDAVVAGLAELGLEANPSNWRRNTMACTGIEYCKLAIVDTKERARALIGELEQRFPDLDTPITINVNGCPNACARTQTADIGLKGMIAMDADGNQVEGFQVHLGGGIGLHDTFGKKLRAH